LKTEILFPRASRDKSLFMPGAYEATATYSLLWPRESGIILFGLIFLIFIVCFPCIKGACTSIYLTFCASYLKNVFFGISFYGIMYVLLSFSTTQSTSIQVTSVYLTKFDCSLFSASSLNMSIRPSVIYRVSCSKWLIIYKKIITKFTTSTPFFPYSLNFCSRKCSFCSSSS